jgi:hypothetical protein
MLRGTRSSSDSAWIGLTIHAGSLTADVQELRPNLSHIVSIPDQLLRSLPHDLALLRRQIAEPDQTLAQFRGIAVPDHETVISNDKFPRFPRRAGGVSRKGVNTQTTRPRWLRHGNLHS